MADRRLKLVAIGWFALWFLGLWIGGYSSPSAANGVGILVFGTIIFGVLSSIAVFILLWLLRNMFGIATLVPFALKKNVTDPS
ncbi:MAG: hypothetical protein EPN20_12995 [Magnetospirillum sp.]|nr:MAG: hypothetical protein EPN20_12995 [Magnetospirillum sp.]